MSALVPGLAAAVLLTALNSYALINPNFTPVHVVQQSNNILELKFEPEIKAGKAVAAVTKELKGQLKAETILIDISAAYKEQAEVFANLVKITAGEPALLFIGIFSEAGNSLEEKKGMLHIGGKWINIFFSEKKGGWVMDKIEDHLQATWAGGTDMLLLAVDYILGDPDTAEVPVSAGVEWVEKKNLGKTEGKVYSAEPVRLYNNEELLLFLAAQKGDRLFKYETKSKTFKDLTASSKLSSASKFHAWGDFNSDGLPDLLSYDGKSLSLQLQTPEKTFKPGMLKIPEMLVDITVLGLSTAASGVKGQLGIIINTGAFPLIWNPQDANPPQNISTGEFLGKELGAAGKCLSADLDGDNTSDLLQLFEKGSLFYKGKTPGTFEEAVPCQIGLGKGFAEAFLGDYNADGSLDVFTVTESKCRLWHNFGGGKFIETIGLSGEISYISKPGGIGGMTGDVNNDGRQDILLLYPDNAYQIFFNRGFRSFGHGRSLNAEEKDLFPEANEGQQSGCLGDFNNDGAQDLAVVLNNGTVGILMSAPGLSVNASMDIKNSYPGPLTVTGWSDKRCLGAWNVTFGAGEAYFGLFEAGPCSFKWQLPGVPAQTKEIILESKPVKYFIK